MTEVEGNKVIRAGIIGASGYAGGELVRLLLGHKKVSIVSLASSTNAGKAAFEVYPSLRGYDLPRFSDVSPGELARNCDVVFAATPPGAAIPLVQEILAGSASAKVVDIGSDFRLKDRSQYHEWYGMT
ncbi:MAG: NAD(P)-binding domain-containing protein, partial [Bacillota bacterium]